jgi:hypothetical protein
LPEGWCSTWKRLTFSTEDNTVLDESVPACLCYNRQAGHHKILAMLEEGTGLNVVYLDFAKAFDKVDHGVLFRKLKLLGVGGE